MLVLQSALHVLFSMTGAHSAAQGTGDAQATTHGHATTAGHPAMGSMGSLDSTASMNPVESLPISPMAMDSGAGMLAVHLLAALLCGLWLAHGEAAFFTLAEAALAYAFTPLRLLFARVRVPDAPRGPVRRPRGNAHRPHTVVLAHTVSRRGPPRLSVPRATALGAHV
ncbi:putative integral-membrane protein [Streptomyces venezuelae]|nr:putative integral-membrane protein [Streptomyces venezuelae]